MLTAHRNDQQRIGIRVYASKSEALGLAYRMTMDALNYLIREKEAGSYTPQEFDNIVIPQLVEQGDENLFMKFYNDRLYIDYQPLDHKVKRLELLLNNI